MSILIAYFAKFGVYFIFKKLHKVFTVMKIKPSKNFKVKSSFIFNLSTFETCCNEERTPVLIHNLFVRTITY